MKIVRVSDKGQIAIPTSIREALKIERGDELILFENGGRILIEKSDKVEDNFKDLLKHSEDVARKLWDNKEDEIWDKV